jgi:endonuclease/exonuclease/phosphatase family metal-dependent hydrolase
LTLKNILATATLVAGAFVSTAVMASQPDAPWEQSSECTTIKPGPDWICAGGGWYPPGMPIPGQSPTVTAPATSTACTTVKPGPDWVCAAGGWYPPGMPLPASHPSVVAVSPTPSAVCTTIQPGPDWVCAGGGWYPPGMPIPGYVPVEPTTSSPAVEWSSPSYVEPSAPYVEPAAPVETPSAPEWSAPVSTPQASSSADGGRLRVMTWNIHFGHGDTWGQAREIANAGADVVLLQEASTFDEYMPTTYTEKLQQLTGQRWYSVWAPHGGRYSDNEGTLILSRLPLVDQSTMNSNERGFARAVVNVGGVDVTVLNAHLDWDTGMRSAQLEAFLSWGQQFGGPRIAGGDFNSWWGEWWISRVESEYSDTWQDVTGSDGDGYTLNGTVRFDYLFRARDGGSRIVPTAAWVQSTSLSDHSAVLADYTVR